MGPKEQSTLQSRNYRGDALLVIGIDSSHSLNKCSFDRVFSGNRAQKLPVSEAFHSSEIDSFQFALPIDADAFSLRLSARRFEGVSIELPDQSTLDGGLIWSTLQNPLIAGRSLTYRASLTRSPGFEPDVFYSVLSRWRPDSEDRSW